MKKVVLSALIFILMQMALSAQNSSPEMADVMRSNGKIYVVVTVLAIIFAAILIYMVMIDRKISAIEKKVNNK